MDNNETDQELERELRAMWTGRGVPLAKQGAVIADATAKANPVQWSGRSGSGKRHSGESYYRRSKMRPLKAKGTSVHFKNNKYSIRCER